MNPTNSFAINKTGLAMFVFLYILFASLVAVIVFNLLFFPLVSIIQLPYPNVDERILSAIQTFLVIVSSTLSVGLSAESIWQHYKKNPARRFQRIFLILIAFLASILVNYRYF